MLHLLLAASLCAALPPRVVTVLYFDNNSNQRELDVLQKGLADMLVTDLAGVEGLQVVEREKLQKLVEELQLQRTKYFDPATAQKIGRGIGAQFAITGAIVAFDPKVRIDVRLLEVATGMVVMADKVTGDKDRFFDLEDELVHKFVAGLSMGGAAPARSHVSSVDSLAAYSRGLDSADRGDYSSASSQLAKVVAAAPDFQLARDRYSEYLKRQSLLDVDSEQLLKTIDQAPKSNDLKRMSEEDAARYFGYRSLKSQFITHRLRGLMKNGVIPEAKRAEQLQSRSA